MTAQASLLTGNRLHLQHGPIDLIIGATASDEAREKAFSAAQIRFETVLDELVAELPLLRRPMTSSSPAPDGAIAQRMDRATRPFAGEFITRMAAVAGSVADTILAAMLHAAPLRRAYVNNGGDIALHLSKNKSFVTEMSDHSGRPLGRITISSDQGIGGMATSGRHGRSHSFGIADSVTVLAGSAASADAAATLIANAVDLPGHPAIRRTAANALDPNTDLGERLVVTDCAALSEQEVGAALTVGLRRAKAIRSNGQIAAAALFLDGQVQLLGSSFTHPQRSLTDA